MINAKDGDTVADTVGAPLRDYVSKEPNPWRLRDGRLGHSQGLNKSAHCR